MLQLLFLTRAFYLRKRLALIVTVLTIVTLTAMSNVGRVYAQTLVLTPNPVTQGVSVRVTGNGFQQFENAQIQVYTSTAGTCSSIPLATITATTDAKGNLQAMNITTSGMSAGTYCVVGNGFLDPPATVDLVVNSATTPIPIAAQSTPLYFYALPILLAFMGVAYLVMSGRKRE